MAGFSCCAEPRVKGSFSPRGFEPETTLDLHGKNRYQARVAIEAALRRSAGVSRIRLIHGYVRGTSLRDMIAEEYGADERVLRLEQERDGVTALVLRPGSR